MNITQALSLIARDQLSNELKVAEPELLEGLKRQHDYTTRVSYRCVSRYLCRRGRVPSFWKMPVRLRGADYRCSRIPLTEAEFGRICKAVEKLLLRIAEFYIALKPIPKHIADKLSPDERVERYRRQNTQIERKYRVTREVDHSAPVAQSVRCVELGVTFPSACQAAKFIRSATGNAVLRSDIRTAIRRGHKCGTWRGPLPRGRDVVEWRSAQSGAVTALTWQYAGVEQRELVAA